jgi:hypothetical protein
VRKRIVSPLDDGDVAKGSGGAWDGRVFETGFCARGRSLDTVLFPTMSSSIEGVFFNSNAGYLNIRRPIGGFTHTPIRGMLFWLDQNNTVMQN